MFGFEKLDVWIKAVELADDVYRLTREFPDYERFGLANQMRRAAVSISSNIAEGGSRSSRREYIRFIEIAYGSTMELVSQLHIAQRQSFIETERARDLYRRCDEVARMLSGLKSSLQRKPS
jgi:four helix bundle protein